MAIDWIKMRVDLQSHPKVVRILSATKSDKFRVIGGLHAVWCVFDAHSEDGVLNGYTPEALDHIVGWDGLSSALLGVGWLLENDGVSLAMPEFYEHNGQSAKRRAEDQKRKRDSRNSPQSVRTLSANTQDEKQTREEKKREEVNTEAVSPKVSPPEGVSINVWADFLKYRRLLKAPVTDTAVAGFKREAEKAGISLEQALVTTIENNWRGFKAEWLKDKPTDNKFAGAI